MMTLNRLQPKQLAVVKKIECDEELKYRLYSFGIVKGAMVVVEEISLAKNTIIIVADDTQVALRYEEASLIYVEICK